MFPFLNPQSIEAIHNATLRIMDETGVVVNHAGAREMLLANGARVEKNRVRIPPDLVEKCVAAAGKKVSVRGRNGTVKHLGDGNLYFHNLGGARDVLDPVTGTKRLANAQDVRDSTRLLDALENCHTITPFFTPCDAPGDMMSLAMYRHALPHTVKPLQGPGVQYAPEARAAVRMAEVIGTPSEVLTLAVSPVSPLTIPDHEVDAIFEIARLRIAFAPLPCPTAGATAPLSIAGALAQQNAEVLMCVVLAQLANPGLPIIYCGRLAMMEPRTGVSVWGGVELGLASAGTVGLGHRYGFPVNVYGFSTNAHSLDLQSGFERGLNAMIPALAGADELSGIGEMEAGVSGSYAQMVADNEFAGSVLRACRGFEVNDDSLAVELFQPVMDGSRNFLGQKHTMKYLRAGEVLMTKLSERGTWETWEKEGRPELARRAQSEAERILREHKVEPLEERQENELDKILAEAEKEMEKK
ncbi:MAG: trimethylamine methyltransferase family protein [Anaerolineales bacterium]|jgi:trimethylamine--corrinoid protein Co-methyltransferase|nr:trimethylamine methyltransferase family protein [Anaerolineales bacterium]GER79906.1 trimethylamine:corrinoid methyltransferase [Candidatus Denitrolinea symbiosum]